MKQVTNTIRSRLKAYRRGSVLSVKQQSMTRTSAVFRVPLRECTTVYYKISAKVCLEALYTQTLARLLPELVVIPFGVNLTDNSFFTKDFVATVGKVVKSRNQEFSDKYLIGPSVNAIAEFHQQASKHVEELKLVGMDDTSPQQMRIELREFISEMEEMEILTDEGAQIMRKQLPQLFTKLDLLTNGKVPVTVCHADLHEDNLTWPESVDDKPLLFDWFDSTISHPFFDILFSNFGKYRWLKVYAKKREAYASLDEIWGLIDLGEYVHPLWSVFRYMNKMARDNDPVGVENAMDFCRCALRDFVKKTKSTAK